MYVLPRIIICAHVCLNTLIEEVFLHWIIHTVWPIKKGNFNIKNSKIIILVILL